MKFNWKSKTFLVSLFSLCLILVQQIGGILGINTTIYNEEVTNIFNSILAILILFGIINNPQEDEKK